MALSSGAVVALMHQAGFPPSEWEVGAAIAYAESRYDPVLRAGPNDNGSFDHGLWQINSVHSALLATRDWRDPLDNTRMAYQLWNRNRSWSDWITYTRRGYSPWLSLARQGVAAHRMAHQGLGEDPSGEVSRADQTLSGQIKSGQQRDTSLTPGESVSQSVDQIASAVEALQRAETWIRVGMVAGGVILVLIGISLSFYNTPMARQSRRTATRVFKSFIGSKVKAVKAGVTGGNA